MLKMNKLQKSAIESCEMQGHSMGPWESLDDHRMASVCTGCCREVVCNTRPSPNQIPVGGEAIALGCTKQQNPYPSVVNRAGWGGVT